MQSDTLFFEFKIARSDRDAVFLPSHFSDILDACKQIQMAKVDAISFSIAETTPFLSQSMVSYTPATKSNVVL